MHITYSNDIQKHTYSIPVLVREMTEPVYRSCFEKLADFELSTVNKIVITGCGYSYAAALAVKDYLIELTNLPIVVLPAIEASRFSHACAGSYDGTLFIAISNSGSVSRINEAAALYKKNGAIVIGLTANPDGDLKNHSDYLLDTSSPSIGRSLPLRGYAMTLLTLLAIGQTLYLKKSNQSLSAINTHIKDFCSSMYQLEDSMATIDHSVLQYVMDHKDIRSFEFVGSGFERAAAFLGKIEMMGQAGLLASDEDSEQWCHCNFFISHPEQIGTVIFLAKNSPAASRAREALSYMIHLKRPVLVVTDDDEITSTSEQHVIHLPRITTLNAGLFEMTVPSFLTGYVCELIGETYSRGFRDQWAVFKDGSGTCKSEIIIQ